jgi:glutaredoxin
MEPVDQNRLPQQAAGGQINLLQGKGGVKMLEVYIKDGCPYSEKQLSVLDRKGTEYKLINVGTDLEALKKIKEEYKATMVPVVVEDGVVKNIGFGGGG